jgi:tetraacyldisaccharide 4'-kinase
MLNLERHWYRSSYSWLAYVLLPLSGIFYLLTTLRRFLYRIKVKKSHRFFVPVIVVGNITVGGTGKTPFVIWLANFLIIQGLRPGIVSRGVGGQQQRLPRWVDKSSDPAFLGDEAILLAKQSNCPVVVGIDRVAAVKELLAKTACNVVISDDGLQHYRLKRDIEIAIIDGRRGLGNRTLLPAGPLRELPSRLEEVDFVVKHVASSEQQITKNEYKMLLRGNVLVSVKDEQQKIPFNQFLHKKVHAVAAIGHPQRFFDTLRREGFDIIEHVFLDHYLYQSQDFDFGDALPIIMTEKDAVKCRLFSDERFWYLPVTMAMDTLFCERLLTILNPALVGEVVNGK